MKPAQQLAVGSEVAGRAAWALGGCLLTPETLFMKGSSRQHCSLGPGTKGSECSFV